MRLEVTQPVLDFADMAKLRDIEPTPRQVPHRRLDITYPLSWGKEGVEARWRRCAPRPWTPCAGNNILIVSDRISATQVAIPALLATVGHPPAPGAPKACAPPPAWW
jgi:glutamate synthase (NADPH/NADH) large chain/glutamate synthase (ferredoxin)